MNIMPFTDPLAIDRRQSSAKLRIQAGYVNPLPIFFVGFPVGSDRHFRTMEGAGRLGDGRRLPIGAV